MTLLKLQDQVCLRCLCTCAPSHMVCCSSRAPELVWERTPLGHALCFHRGSKILLATNHKGIVDVCSDQLDESVLTWWISPTAMFYLIEFDQQLVHNYYSKNKKWNCSNYVNECVGLLTPVTSGLPMRKLVWGFFCFLMKCFCFLNLNSPRILPKCAHYFFCLI